MVDERGEKTKDKLRRRGEEKKEFWRRGEEEKEKGMMDKRGEGRNRKSRGEEREFNFRSFIIIFLS